MKDRTKDRPYYRDDLARVHHLGFGFHADACAGGMLDLLASVRNRDGLIVELGCGSGHLTRHLVKAGLRVIATDASQAMLELARREVPKVQELRQLVLPDDPIPAADAIVSVGHVLSYLSDEAAIHRALRAICGALRPGGVLALDICDLSYGETRRKASPFVSVNDEWAIVTRFSAPASNRFVRDITTFVRDDEGTWRRDDERHENVLIDTSDIPKMLHKCGVNATLGSSFGGEKLPEGLVTIIGQRS